MYADILSDSSIQLQNIQQMRSFCSMHANNKRHVNQVVMEHTLNAALHPSPHPLVILRKSEKI